MTSNIDNQVVAGFGDEWSRFDQTSLSDAELRMMFDNYFNIFPWDKLPPTAVGFDLGCGSGRWAKLVAPRVGKLSLLDPSPDALAVAKRNLAGADNCEFHLAGAANIPFADDSCDFGYSLGVLHHIPDTEAGLRACVAKLKPARRSCFISITTSTTGSLVPRLMENEQCHTDRDLPSAPRPAIRHQPGFGCPCLFPPRSHSSHSRKTGRRPCALPSVAIPPQQLLRNAERRPRPLWHAARKTFFKKRNSGNDGTSWPAGDHL
jgi:SAM-dependent methyltransferase